jgi:hypothetical protein
MGAYKEEITVKVGPPPGRKVKIEAVRVGQYFAIHRTLMPGEELSHHWWSVTHIPSGWASGTKYDTNTQARRAAYALERIPVEWAEVRDTNDERLLPHRAALRTAAEGKTR